jgi:hypothetical protein
MSSTRRRSARLDPARFRLGSNLEALESRQLLTQSPWLSVNDYPLTNTLPVQNPGSVPLPDINHPIGTNPAILSGYSNEGKVISGEDRQGNRYTLKLTGPGEIIVTDTSPNDGALDDNINTITLVGTSPTQSVLTGTVEASFNQPTTPELLSSLGQVYFNALVDNQGIKTIILNGFVLTDTITPAGSATLSPLESALNQTTGINLAGGVGLLEFEGIDGRFPNPTADSPTDVLNPPLTSDPIDITIGNSTTPLTVKPNIRIDHIYNTAYDSSAFAQEPDTGLINDGTIPTGPLTTPTIDFQVNGELASFDVVSIGQTSDLQGLTNTQSNQTFVGEPNATGTQVLTKSTPPSLVIPTQFIPTSSAALEYQYPIVGTTGRTAVQASSINHIKSAGSVTNVTFSKAIQPFENSLSGLDSVGYVQFGGQTDAVGIDSQGNIKLLKFEQGLGNPTGDSTNPIYYGTPTSAYGYAALGQEGVQVVTEGTIGKLVAGPKGQFLQTSQNPSQIQAGLAETEITVNQAGQAVTESLVAAGGSIGKIHIVGDLTNSEIKAGYNYYAAIGGSEGVGGAASTVGPLTLRGSLVDSVISASYRPNDGVYGNGNDTAGDGTITGARSGQILATTTGTTVLGNQGSGIFAKTKKVAVHPAGSNQDS